MSEEKYYLFGQNNKSSTYNIDEQKALIRYTNENKNSAIKAGYTYLGQMIAHEIISSTSIHTDTRNEEIVSPELNLKSLYDYENICDNFEVSNKIIFNKFGQFNLLKSKGIDDVIRCKNGEAIIPEPRNDENIIIIQFHLLWQKFHNKIIEEKYKEKIIYGSISKEEAIRETKEIVTFIFQQVIIDDYLTTICHSKVERFYKKNTNRIFFKQKLKHIPYEFSLAAFRFGHSMIRNSYRLRVSKFREDKIFLKDLFLKSGEQLQPKHKICWNKFFDIKSNGLFPNNGVAQVASRIDTNIAEGMMNIHNSNNIEKPHDILDINIKAGIKLKTGKEIYHDILTRFKKYGCKDITNELESEISYPLLKVLENIKFDVSLWPYILLESENSIPKSKTAGLGIIGSTIVCEVLLASIDLNRSKLDVLSYKNNMKFIKNTINKKKKSNKRKITMNDIINYLGERCE